MIERVNIWLPSWESTLYDMVVPYTINIGNNLNQNSRILFLEVFGTCWYTQYTVHVGTMLASHS